MRIKTGETVPGLEGYSPDDLALPPETEAGETLCVDFRLTVFHVNKVMTRELTANVKMGVIFYWTDPRMIGHEHPILPPTLWGPTVCLKNAVGGVSEDYEQFVVAEPQIGRMKRIINFEATIGTPMDLHNFPFDIQDVQPQFVSISHWRQVDRTRHGSVPYGQTYKLRPVCLPQEGNLLMMLWSGRMSEWTLRAFHVQVQSQVPAGGFTVTSIRVHLYLVRRYKFYLIKGVGPLVILALCTFVVQKIQVEELAARLKVWSAMFLAVFSLLNLYGQQVPPMDFLTTLDKAVYLTIGIMVWIGLESWIVARLAETDRALSEQVNEWLFATMPVLYLLAIGILLLKPYFQLHKEVARIRKELLEDDTGKSQTSGWLCETKSC